jgi:hypothetical protein
MLLNKCLLLLKFKGVGWRVGGVAGASASYTDVADSADLGSSSKSWDLITQNNQNG